MQYARNRLENYPSENCEEESKIFFIIEFQVQSKTGRFSSGIIGELNRLQIF